MEMSEAVDHEEAEVEGMLDDSQNLLNGKQQPVGAARKRPGLRKYAKLDPAMAKDILQKAESGELASMAYQYGDRVNPKPGHLYLVHAPASENPFRAMRFKDSFDWQHSSKHTWPEAAGTAQIKFIFYKLRPYHRVDPAAVGFKQRRIYWLIDAEEGGYDSYILVEYAPLFTPQESTNFTLASPETDPPISDMEHDKIRGENSAIKKRSLVKKPLGSAGRTANGKVNGDGGDGDEADDVDDKKRVTIIKKRRSKRVVKVSDRFQAAINDLDKAQKMTKMLRNKLESLYHLSLLRKELVE